MADYWQQRRNKKRKEGMHGGKKAERKLKVGKPAPVPKAEQRREPQGEDQGPERTLQGALDALVDEIAWQRKKGKFERMWKDMDVDSDKEVSLKEFRTYCRKFQMVRQVF